MTIVRILSCGPHRPFLIETQRAAGSHGEGAIAISQSAAVVSLVVLVALVTIGDPHFLSASNITNMLGQWAPAGIMAVAMTYVIIARGFDLSLASGFSLCAITAATMAAQGSSRPLAFAAALAVGIP